MVKMNKNKIFDAHTHFNEALYEKEGHSVNELVADAQKNNVDYFLNVAWDLNSSKLTLKQAEQHPHMFVSIGFHPMEIHKFSIKDLEKLEPLIRQEKVVAIGEVGLDYYWKKDNKEAQKYWFNQQIDLANKYDLPVMMHIRDDRDNFAAYDDALEVLKENPGKRMIVHCFSANKDYAKKFLDLGCYINIGGAVTFKNAKELQEAATMIPLNRLLLETDAPYLTPHPHRGKINFIRMINYTVDKLAELKNVSREKIINETTKNAFKVFNLNAK